MGGMLDAASDDATEGLASVSVGAVEGLMVAPSFIGVRRIKAITIPVTIKGRATYFKTARVALDLSFVMS